ncbi:hypothetical protein C8R44DRAFT_750393 [Mycena epipterygia]|nr:hypothetical protein C8R44DRAFT_750393 [Mycena epipterygia]
MQVILVLFAQLLHLLECLQILCKERRLLEEQNSIAKSVFHVEFLGLPPQNRLGDIFQSVNYPVPRAASGFVSVHLKRRSPRIDVSFVLYLLTPDRDRSVHGWFWCSIHIAGHWAFALVEIRISYTGIRDTFKVQQLQMLGVGFR